MIGLNWKLRPNFTFHRICGLYKKELNNKILVFAYFYVVTNKLHTCCSLFLFNIF